MLDRTRKPVTIARPDEPEYAYVPIVDGPQLNHYGKPVQLVDSNDPRVGKSLNINNDNSVSDNPNRYKQHGFYFNADNCISCHACESACSEKNDLPAHLAFRSVGYIEGGTWPSYTRVNISMACNHCDDPVCLKGCPTRAYTKFAEYGAVLQDPDICFGCGYCTWVCPYNAPQLDPVKGQVEKCNMCVDRLELGLKPACATACLAGALDFGVIDTMPENREQLGTCLPGFPSPDITHPNIRFQQKKSLPREMSRTDAMPIRYERDAQGRGEYRTKVKETGTARQWGLRKLRSREDPLVIFTLISQAVIGAFALLFLAPVFGMDSLSSSLHPVVYPAMLFVLLGLETFALVLSTMHLGKPQRFYRAFNNLRYSPVSREVAGLAVFYNLLAGYALLSAWPGLFWLPGSVSGQIRDVIGWGAVVAGPLAIYFMHRIYRIKARPFWNHWQVLSSFYGNMFSLGAVLVGILFVPVSLATDGDTALVVRMLGAMMFAGLVIESLGLYRHGKAMRQQGGEGAASDYMQRTLFGKTWLLRNTLLAIAIILSAVITVAGMHGMTVLILWGIAASLVIMTSTLGRALFYVLVIPTTMPGAFFWRNSGFQEHARKTGLANMPQTGVIPGAH